MTMQTLQPEAGDDRGREAEIARLEEMYARPFSDDTRSFEPDVLGSGAGEMQLIPVSSRHNTVAGLMGYCTLRRTGIRFN